MTGIVTSFLPEQFSSLEISPSRTARYSFMGTRGGSGHAALPCISARIVSVPFMARRRVGRRRFADLLIAATVGGVMACPCTRGCARRADDRHPDQC